MREREKVERQADTPVDGSVKDSVEAGNRLLLEVLLDIRDLLERVDSRIDDLQSRIDDLRSR